MRKSSNTPTGVKNYRYVSVRLKAVLEGATKRTQRETISRLRSFYPTEPTGHTPIQSRPKPRTGPPPLATLRIDPSSRRPPVSSDSNKHNQNANSRRGAGALGGGATSPRDAPPTTWRSSASARTATVAGSASPRSAAWPLVSLLEDLLLLRRAALDDLRGVFNLKSGKEGGGTRLVPLGETRPVTARSAVHSNGVGRGIDGDGGGGGLGPLSAETGNAIVERQLRRMVGALRRPSAEAAMRALKEHQSAAGLADMIWKGGGEEGGEGGWKGFQWQRFLCGEGGGLAGVAVRMIARAVSRCVRQQKTSAVGQWRAACAQGLRLAMALALGAASSSRRTLRVFSQWKVLTIRRKHGTERMTSVLHRASRRRAALGWRLLCVYRQTSPLPAHLLRAFDACLQGSGAAMVSAVSGEKARSRRGGGLHGIQTGTHGLLGGTRQAETASEPHTESVRAGLAASPRPSVQSPQNGAVPGSSPAGPLRAGGSSRAPAAQAPPAGMPPLEAPTEVPTAAERAHQLLKKRGSVEELIALTRSLHRALVASDAVVSDGSSAIIAASTLSPKDGGGPLSLSFVPKGPGKDQKGGDPGECVLNGVRGEGEALRGAVDVRSEVFERLLGAREEIERSRKEKEASGETLPVPLPGRMVADGAPSASSGSFLENTWRWCLLRRIVQRKIVAERRQAVTAWWERAKVIAEAQKRQLSSFPILESAVALRHRLGLRSERLVLIRSSFDVWKGEVERVKAEKTLRARAAQLIIGLTGRPSALQKSFAVARLGSHAAALKAASASGEGAPPPVAAESGKSPYDLQLRSKSLFGALVGSVKALQAWAFRGLLQHAWARKAKIEESQGPLGALMPLVGGAVKRIKLVLQGSAFSHWKAMAVLQAGRDTLPWGLSQRGGGSEMAPESGGPFRRSRGDGGELEGRLETAERVFSRKLGGSVDLGPLLRGEVMTKWNWKDGKRVTSDGKLVWTPSLDTPADTLHIPSLHEGGGRDARGMDVTLTTPRIDLSQTVPGANGRSAKRPNASLSPTRAGAIRERSKSKAPKKERHCMDLATCRGVAYAFVSRQRVAAGWRAERDREEWMLQVIDNARVVEVEARSDRQLRCWVMGLQYLIQNFRKSAALTYDGGTMNRRNGGMATAAAVYEYPVYPTDQKTLLFRLVRRKLHLAAEARRISLPDMFREAVSFCLQTPLSRRSILTLHDAPQVSSPPPVQDAMEEQKDPRNIQTQQQQQRRPGQGAGGGGGRSGPAFTPPPRSAPAPSTTAPRGPSGEPHRERAAPPPTTQGVPAAPKASAAAGRTGAFGAGRKGKAQAKANSSASPTGATVGGGASGGGGGWGLGAAPKRGAQARQAGW
uniref:PH domain-containing protein n=1 Tax=Chromera velia CCMP2878 TaxID=1169474 RepID=A0A0G4F3Z2_9ALVE|eukprot:Cvel_171.t1-p1 / transcript=Cvel_171.t1 / gene=Cvel_171 / organism=Chromera_velia_CCMP2878 / gene_product=hypothetical protein / transcript_product=hypothetical protein / location=Cvel_scaffold10:233706-241436(+) / protein_length=1350 / sequence_SO=supercontig / SO=protein_coding / is_pseudo=false